MLKHDIDLVNRCNTIRGFICNAIQAGCDVDLIAYHYMISSETIWDILNGKTVYLHKSIYKYVIRLWVQLIEKEKKDAA